MSSPIVILPTSLTGLQYFPAAKFQGLKIDITRTVEFDNTISRAASGREVGVSWRELPIITLDLAWEFLDANQETSSQPSDGSPFYTEFAWLLGFFEAMHGDLLPFYLRMADLPGHTQAASQVTGQQIGTGDAVTTNFQLYRTVGPYFEPIQMPDPAGTVVVYLDGVVQPSGWTLLSRGIIQFASAPAAGKVITADFSWVYLCRFAESSADFEQFAYLVHECKSLKLRTVIQ